MAVSIRLCAVAAALTACSGDAGKASAPIQPPAKQPTPVIVEAPDAAPPKTPPIVRLKANETREQGEFSITIGSIGGDEPDSAHISIRNGEETTSTDMGAGETFWSNGIMVDVIEIDTEVTMKVGWPAKEKSSNRVRLEKGKDHALSDGWKVRFAAHSHKRVQAGGPSSPLITYMEYIPPEGEPIEDSYNLKPPVRASWWWRHAHFSQHEHDYGSWIDVTITEYELEYLR